MIRPRGDDDDESWADEQPAHIGCVYPLGDRPKRRVKKPDFPIGFEIPQPPKPEAAAPKRRRKAKRKGR